MHCKPSHHCIALHDEPCYRLIVMLTDLTCFSWGFTLDARACSKIVYALFGYCVFVKIAVMSADLAIFFVAAHLDLHVLQFTEEENFLICWSRRTAYFLQYCSEEKRICVICADRLRVFLVTLDKKTKILFLDTDLQHHFLD